MMTATRSAAFVEPEARGFMRSALKQLAGIVALAELATGSPARR